MARIYVSSTFSDLEECREQVRLALRRLGHEDVAMEYYGATDERPLDRCLKDVEACDLYVGIFAWRYGSIPKGYKQSVTELEYRQAVAKDKDRLLFLLAEDAPWPMSRMELKAMKKIKALRKAEMTKAESDALVAHLQGKLRRGEALLLLDGLDEISDTVQRTRFCEQIEHIQAAYPQAPIIATSRIVGYREMGQRIGRGFEHLTITDLEREEKDDFARRWCAMTERPEKREAATQELIHDIHSSERIERLTGNPMLLTTLALVKRKVGKLPTRRVELYGEALEVLLNWRAEVDEPLDKREAVPQLEYLAYAMCDRGTQQLREDEVLELFERMRGEFPQVYAACKHTPEEFLRLLERRTGILVEAGRVPHKGRGALVYEFRHLTFQKYLAGLALVDGRFPGHAPGRSLAQVVAPWPGGRAKRMGVIPVERS